ncbi:pyruvate kinase [soil metagenome]
MDPGIVEQEKKLEIFKNSWKGKFEPGMNKTDENFQEELINRLEELYEGAVALEKKFASSINKAHPKLKKSAKNLLHYLSLRQHDIRELQDKLSQQGFSSLGRIEGHVLASLQAVIMQLCKLTGKDHTVKYASVSFFENKALLSEHTEMLLGPKPDLRTTRIMVTLPGEIAENYELLLDLLKAGMNCARINCAHDDENTWFKMIKNIKKARKETGKPCKILMDLMGPKLRTGPLKEGPQLIEIHPPKIWGKATEPAKIWLGSSEKTPKNIVASLPADAEWLAQLKSGDKIKFKDANGHKRAFFVIEKNSKGVIVELYESSYIKTGTKMSVKNKSGEKFKTKIDDLPPLYSPIILKKDHLLELTRLPIPGEPALFNSKGDLIRAAHISCTLPDIFSQVKEGQPILFNDGKIEGKILEVTDDKLLIKIIYAGKKGSKLRADHGINLPETKIHVHGLTEKDKEDLKFVAKNSDIVNLSFVNDVENVETLHQELQKLKVKKLGIMLKIETKEGFLNLPHILLALMKFYPAGIMIARGDLAVECGWQRLAEVQEEILWICEAAQIPAVWATQVLENLAQKGRPSRAEITDAAMAQRADCVMLNKGPHIVQAIELLHDILVRMQGHQNKKTSMLRNLHISEIKEAKE